VRGGWRFKSGIVESVNLPSVASGFRRPSRNCGTAVTVGAAKAAGRIGIARESGYNRALSTQVEFTGRANGAGRGKRRAVRFVRRFTIDLMRIRAKDETNQI